MSLLKSTKDIRAAVESSRLADADGAGASKGHHPEDMVDPDFKPVDGVSLETFVMVCRAMASVDYDETKVGRVALTQGLDEVTWLQASKKWNARLRRNPSVAQRFIDLYVEAEPPTH